MFKNLSFRRAANKKQKSHSSSTSKQKTSSNDENIFDRSNVASSDARIETGILKIQIAEKLERYKKNNT